MRLGARLLAGLAALVFVAIGLTGWLTLRWASLRLDGAEEERARAVAAAVAGLIEPDRAARAAMDPEARGALDATARGLLGVGGISDVAIIDGMRHPLAGDPGDDPDFAFALGGTTLERRNGPTLLVYAPVRHEGGAVAGAVRVKINVGTTVVEAVRGSTLLLIALTLVDGGLILLFGTLFVRSLVRPVEALARASRRVASGDLAVDPVQADRGTGEIAELAEAFNQMTAALREQKAGLEESRALVLAQEKLATVGRFAAGVAHEIGNPLTTILGMVGLLLADTPAGESRDALVRVQSETERIRRIIHDLLDYGRPVSELEEPVQVDEVVDGALALLRPQPRFRGVSVTRRSDGGAGGTAVPAVAASASRVLQVLLNLLLNAADAMGGKGAIVIETRRAGDRVELDVSDEGPGIPAERRERLFEPFFTTKEPGAGTGLGLAVCRAIARAYGGEVRFVPPEASPDFGPTARGARFRLSLPVYGTTARTSRRLATVPAPPG